MHHTATKQTKLSGAAVRDLGTVTAVSTTLNECFAVVEDDQKVNPMVLLADLAKDDVTFPLEPQPDYTAVERVSYGTWCDVFATYSAMPVAI